MFYQCFLHMQQHGYAAKSAAGYLFSLFSDKPAFSKGDIKNGIWVIFRQRLSQQTIRCFFYFQKLRTQNGKNGYLLFSSCQILYSYCHVLYNVKKRVRFMNMNSISKYLQFLRKSSNCTQDEKDKNSINNFIRIQVYETS